MNTVTEPFRACEPKRTPGWCKSAALFAGTVVGYELTTSIAQFHDARFSVLHAWGMDDEVLLSWRLNTEEVASRRPIGVPASEMTSGCVVKTRFLAVLSISRVF